MDLIWMPQCTECDCVRSCSHGTGTSYIWHLYNWRQHQFACLIHLARISFEISQRSLGTSRCMDDTAFVEQIREDCSGNRQNLALIPSDHKLWRHHWLTTCSKTVSCATRVCNYSQELRYHGPCSTFERIPFLTVNWEHKETRCHLCLFAKTNEARNCTTSDILSCYCTHRRADRRGVLIL